MAKAEKTGAKPKSNPAQTNTDGSKVMRREVVLVLPAVQVPKVLRPFQGFVDFVREQGVVGLAVGLVLGTQIKSLVDQLVASFINPLIGLLLPGTGDLGQKFFTLAINEKTARFNYGAFFSQLISFLVVAGVIYALVKMLKLDKIDKKKE